MDKCPYETLGLSRDCTAMEIKKAYRNLALKYHPDRVSVGLKESYQEKFCEIVFAYGILSDKDKRETYDKYGVIDDGQTEIVIDESEDMLTSLVNFFREEKEIKKREKEWEKKRREEQGIPEKSFGRRCRDFWCGERNTQWTPCVPCKGKGQIKTEVGFWVVDKKCETCDGVGKVEVEIPIKPTKFNQSNYRDRQNREDYYGNYKDFGYPNQGDE